MILYVETLILCRTLFPSYYCASCISTHSTTVSIRDWLSFGNCRSIRVIDLFVSKLNDPDASGYLIRRKLSCQIRTFFTDLTCAPESKLVHLKSLLFISTVQL